MRLPTRCSLLLTAFVLLAGPAVLAAPDDDAGARYLREQLVKEARSKVRPEAAEGAGLDGLKAALAEDFRLRSSYAPAETPASAEDAELLRLWDATVAARRLLLGDPARVDGEGSPIPPTIGAVQQARTLLRWLRADLPEKHGCGVRILDPRQADESRREIEFSYPNPPGVENAEPPALPVGSGAGLDVPPPGPPPPAAVPAPAPAPAPVPSPALGPGTGTAPPPPPGAAAPPIEPVPAPAPTPAPAPVPASGAESPRPLPPVVAAKLSLEDWAKAVKEAVGGTLLGKEILPAVCSEASLLREAAATPTPLSDPALPPLVRFVLEAEDPFAYNAALVQLRRLQANERVEAFRADRPAPGLVDQGSVDEKAQRAEAYRARVTALEAERAALLVSLDQMVVALDDWKTMDAILGDRIKARKAELAGAETPANGGAGANGHPDLQLRVWSGQQAVAQLEMRLLYHSAVRVDERLGLVRATGGAPTGLLESLLQATTDEATAAEATRVVYHDALESVARERRVDRLQSEARRLGRLEKAAASTNGAGRAQQPQRLAAYRALLAVNAVVLQAAERRRELGAWSVQTRPLEPKESVVDDPIAIARDPRAAVWDRATLTRWREKLSLPVFDADLVAEHYAAGEERLRRLRVAKRTAVDPGAIRLRFQGAAGEADRALAPLVERADWAVRIYRLADLLATWRGDLDDTLSGMQAELARIDERIADVQAYQSDLRNLGPRSFATRIDRDLDAEDLRSAAEDALGGLEEAGDWITLTGDDNIGEFARQRWLGLLAVVASLLAAVFITRKGRRGLDRWLERRARRFPELGWSGASVADERVAAKRRKEEETAAAEARAEELLREVQGEPPPEDGAPAPAATPTADKDKDPGRDPAKDGEKKPPPPPPDPGDTDATIRQGEKA